jgi:acyl dehydratase
MANVFFEEFEIGARRVSHGRTITEADIILHAGQTGDWYPHHVDAEWCATQSIGQRIAHGTLTFSIAVGMIAGEINEYAMSYGYDRIRFIRPVHIGDTITVTAEIAGFRDPHREPEKFGIVDEQVTVVNQLGDVVLVLTHVHLVRRRQATPDEVGAS